MVMVPFVTTKFFFFVLVLGLLSVMHFANGERLFFVTYT